MHIHNKQTHTSAILPTVLSCSFQFIIHLARASAEEFSFFLVCLSNYVWFFRSAYTGHHRTNPRAWFGLPMLKPREHTFIPYSTHLSTLDVLWLGIPSCNLPFCAFAFTRALAVARLLYLYLYFSICLLLYLLQLFCVYTLSFVAHAIAGWSHRHRRRRRHLSVES